MSQLTIMSAKLVKVVQKTPQNALKPLLMRYFCDKKPLQQLEVIKKTTTTKKPVQVENKADRQKLKPATLFESTNKDQALQLVATEKSQDANAQSQLAKECKKMTDKKIVFGAASFLVTEKIKDVDSHSFEDICKKAPVVDKTVTIDLTKKTKTDASGDSSGTVSGANRIVRREHPGKVIWCLIPEEWMLYFIPKTGVTGFYTFLFTFGTFLISKEYYVFEHNYYNGLGMLCLAILSIKYGGVATARYLDKLVDEYETSWNAGRKQTHEVLNESILEEKVMQFQSAGQQLLMNAKRVNVQMQLEEEYRKRQMIVYTQVKKRLDYQIAVQLVRARIHQKNLVDYVTREVLKSITPEMKEKMIDYSIEEIIKEFKKIQH